jgi:hypothetical protein
MPPDFYPTFKEITAAIRAAAGKSDPGYTDPRPDDGSGGGGGSVDPGKIKGDWVKRPLPDNSPTTPLGLPSDHVDDERVRPRGGDPAPIDPEPDYGQQQPTDPGR